MFNTKNVVSKLADYFDKRPDSNISKLLALFSEDMNQIHEVNETVRTWRDIDRAEGTTLDLIGSDVRLTRGPADDPAYRILLKAKIIRNLSDGTVDGIINAIAMTLSEQPDSVQIVEKWHDEFDPEPNTIRALKMPIRRVIEAGMDTEAFVNVIQKSVAAGIKVDEIELWGTFEFGEVGDAYDAERGFSDTNNPEIGGFLGSIYRRNQEQ